MLLLLAAAAMADDCAFRTTLDDLSASLDEAENAYAALDVERFATAVDEAAIVLPCVDAPLRPRDAARFHRVCGIASFINNNPGRAREALSSAKQSEPGYAFPSELVPPGHTIIEIYNVGTPDDPLVDLPVPVDGEIYIDGKRSLARPTRRASIVQHSAQTGGIQTTTYLFSSDPTPEYASKNREASGPAPPLATTTTPTRPKRDKRAPSIIAYGDLGLGFGDVNRTADVFVQTDADGEVSAEWIQEGPIPGNGALGTLGLAVLLDPHLEVGASIGYQLGQKGLTVGTLTAEGSVEGQTRPEWVQAAQVVAQIRAVGHFPPQSALRGRAVLGTELHIFDAYDIKFTDPAYPEPSGGLTWGPMFGLGADYKLTERLRTGLNASAVKNVSTRAYVAQFGQSPTEQPARPPATGFNGALTLFATYALK